LGDEDEDEPSGAGTGDEGTRIERRGAVSNLAHGYYRSVPTVTTGE
jgi:hypothetical protein